MLAMDLIKTIAEETMRFCVGLYGLCVLFSVYYVISFGIERLVNWIGIQKDKYRQIKTRRI